MLIRFLDCVIFFLSLHWLKSKIMKRVIFIVFLSVLLAGSTQAQFSFGVKGGLTISDMNFDLKPDTTADNILNYNAGVFFKFGDGLFSFQPEIIYQGKGCLIKDKQSEWSHQLNFGYIDVPLLARASFNLKVAEIYFNMGPYVGYALSAKSKTNTFDPEQGKYVEDSFTYEWDGLIEQKFDAGIVMGAGVRVLMVIFEVRYNNGLVYTADKDIFDDSRHKYLNFSLGVQF